MEETGAKRSLKPTWICAESTTITRQFEGEYPQKSRNWPIMKFIGDEAAGKSKKKEVQPDVKKRCKLMKRVAAGIVIQSAVVQQLEMKTHVMLKSLFDLLLQNYVDKRPKALLPPEAHTEIISVDREADKARLSAITCPECQMILRSEPTEGSLIPFLDP